MRPSQIRRNGPSPFLSAALVRSFNPENFAYANLRFSHASLSITSLMLPVLLAG